MGYFRVTRRSTTPAHQDSCDKLDHPSVGWSQVHHQSLFYTLWWHSMLIGGLATVLLLPLHFAFYTGEGMAITLYVLDAAFVVDLLISFRRSYTDPITMEVVLDSQRMALHYLRGKFVIDLLAVLPFDQLVLLAVGGSGSLYDPRSLALLGYVKFLRLRRMIKFFKRLELNEALSYSATCILKFLAVLLLNAHTGGCSMWFLASLRTFDPAETWIRDSIEVRDYPYIYMNIYIYMQK